MRTDERKRCPWAGTDPAMRAYHDEEWGRPVHDDRVLFEFLTLEGAQAGLSWSTILRKREGYRRAFAGFDPGYRSGTSWAKRPGRGCERALPTRAVFGCSWSGRARRCAGPATTRSGTSSTVNTRFDRLNLVHRPYRRANHKMCFDYPASAAAR
ncbi:MAG TPA: DNA-3-methyladenine glycosylase I [Myxococcales bacterium]